MNLHQYRKLNYISVKQASEELGVSRQHIYDIEKRKSFPSRKLSVKIYEWSHGLVSQVELLFPDLTKSISNYLIKVENREGNASQSKKPRTQGTQIMRDEAFINI
jgi:DNA-binding XRE family transcriptional regulator